MDDIHDVKAPLALTYNYLPLIILFAILFLLLILLIYLSVKRKKARTPAKEPATVEIKLSPRDIALMELDKIKKDRLIELNKTDIFYNRLTEIIKNICQDSLI
jgi:hypothetical protein